jgi:hypothetical protein
MARHIKLAFSGIIATLLLVACGGDGGNAAQATGGGGNVPNTIILDDRGMGCVNVEDNLTKGVMHKVCCRDQAETPDPAASSMCHGDALLGCEAATGGCIVYSSDTDREGVVCPGSMSCGECFAGGLNAPAAAACN